MSTKSDGERWIKTVTKLQVCGRFWLVTVGAEYIKFAVSTVDTSSPTDLKPLLA